MAFEVGAHVALDHLVTNTFFKDQMLQSSV